ncbi:MAG: SprT family zinc-dependent metalloprotease [Rikenellaceae bacterium]|nr:SprT family zinc-dependent metalloprotease [Rikenellaceae bacterium]
MLTRKYYHHLFGEIVITKKSGNKNIRLTVSPSKGIRVSIPFFTSFSRAGDFVTEKEEWIKATLDKHYEKMQSRIIPLGEGNDLFLIGNKVIYRKISRTEKKERINIKYYPGHTEINFPEGCNKEAIMKATLIVMRKRASLYLPARCLELASAHGFSFNRLFLKNNKTNWGSCSNKGNINLNIQLMRLSPELADYVILHELCHLKYHNHGASFHKLLNTLCEGKEKELASQLRKNNTSSLTVI